MSAPSFESVKPEALAHNLLLAPDESKKISLSTEALLSPDQTLSELGISVPTIARVQAGNQVFSILDTRFTGQFKSSLLILDRPYQGSDRRGYQGVGYEQEVVVGRSHLSDRFDYDPTVSRTHFGIAYDGVLATVRNYRPSNRTLLTGDIAGRDRGLVDPIIYDQVGRVVASFTVQAIDDVKHRHDFGEKDITAPYGYYRNHMIIGRDTPTVKDGVYFSSGSEAVIVDDKSAALRNLAKDTLKAVQGNLGRIRYRQTNQILELVNKITARAIPYSADVSEKLGSPLFDNNGLIGLSEYVQAGGGVCRHQCLLAAFLIEDLVDNGILEGRVGVERNHDLDAHGAHAWAVYKGPAEPAIVIDPAQNFVGTKQEARQQGRWKYDLPADSF